MEFIRVLFRSESELRKQCSNMMTPSTRPLPAGSMRFVQGRTTSARAGARPPLSSFGFTPVRPEHPVRAKDDGDGQVSWLAGQGRSGPPSQDRLVPMAY